MQILHFGPFHCGVNLKSNDIGDNEWSLFSNCDHTENVVWKYRTR